MNPAIDRTGATVNGFTVLRRGYKKGKNVMWHVVHNHCGIEVPKAVRWEKLPRRVCTVCNPKLPTLTRRERRARERAALKIKAELESQQKDRLDRVYRFFVSMPTHDLNNRWNDD